MAALLSSVTNGQLTSSCVCSTRRRAEWQEGHRSVDHATAYPNTPHSDPHTHTPTVSPGLGAPAPPRGPIHLWRPAFAPGTVTALVCTPA